MADRRHAVECYRLCESAFENNEQRAESLPRTTARPRTVRRPRCLQHSARTCCGGGHLDAVRRPRPMALRGLVRHVRHTVRARFHSSRRLVLVRPASSPTLADPIAAVGDWLRSADSRRSQVIEATAYRALAGLRAQWLVLPRTPAQTRPSRRRLPSAQLDSDTGPCGTRHTKKRWRHRMLFALPKPAETRWSFWLVEIKVPRLGDYAALGRTEATKTRSPVRRAAE